MSSFPIVGIVTSIRGLGAFTELIRHLPTDTGMAFVLIQLLSPNRESLLPKLLSRVTVMPVHQVRDRMVVEPNEVYVIPPKTQMTLADGMLHLAPCQASDGKYLPGDVFLESLAADRGPKAIAVVLSGASGDGAQGLKAIKVAGGVTFVECESTARSDSMLDTTVAKGDVDFVLPLRALATELAKLSRSPFSFNSEPPQVVKKVLPELEDLLTTILVLLQTVTDIDLTFSKFLQQQAQILPKVQHAILLAVFEEFYVVLEALQASEAELRSQNRTLVSTRQAIEVERQRYQELFEFAPDGYLMTDTNGIIQEANAAITALLNIPRRFLVGKPLAVYVARSELHTFHLDLSHLRRSEKRQDWEVRLLPRERPPFDATITVSAGRNAGGQLTHFRWLLRDITERKRVEQLLAQLNVELEQQVRERTAELQQSLAFEAGLKRITDKVRDSLDERQILQAAVRELSLVLGLVCCNTALYDLDTATSTVQYEFTNPEKGIASSSLALGKVVPMNQLPEHYLQLLQGKYFQFCELDVDSAHHRAISVYPLCDDQGVLGDLWLFKPKEETFNELELRLIEQVANQCAIAIRQARLFQASQAQIEALQKLDQLKDDFLSTTSHELRSPVANMKLAIRMLTIAIDRDRRSAQLAPLETEVSRVDRYLQILEMECDREINLINDLLDLQRMEAEKQTLTPEPLQLQDWLPSKVIPFQERAQARQQTLQLVLPPTLPSIEPI